MDDTEIRGIILQWFYEHREEGKITPKQDDFNPPIADSAISRICKQLDEHRLINWEGIYKHEKWSQPPKLVRMHGEISAKGIDVVEKGGHPFPFGITFTQNISVSQSQVVQIGDGNIQSITYALEQLISQIENSKAEEAEKQEAKSKLKAFLKHPLVTSVLGGLAGKLIDMLGG